MTEIEHENLVRACKFLINNKQKARSSDLLGSASAKSDAIALESSIRTFGILFGAEHVAMEKILKETMEYSQVMRERAEYLANAISSFV